MANPLALPRNLPKTYAELVALHVPRPIHDEVSYHNTVQLVEARAGMTLNRDQEDLLEFLGQQVGAYEAETLKAPKQETALVLIGLLCEGNGFRRDDLSDLLEGDRSVAYKMLEGTRYLTSDRLRRFATRFVISADAILAGGERLNDPEESGSVTARRFRPPPRERRHAPGRRRRTEPGLRRSWLSNSDCLGAGMTPAGPLLCPHTTKRPRNHARRAAYVYIENHKIREPLYQKRAFPAPC